MYIYKHFLIKTTVYSIIFIGNVDTRTQFIRCSAVRIKQKNNRRKTTNKRASHLRMN